MLVLISLLVSILNSDIDQNLNISPQRQERIDHGVLIRWTKGFGATNTEGEDVAAMFRKSLQKYVNCPLHFFTPHLFNLLSSNYPSNLRHWSMTPRERSLHLITSTRRPKLPAFLGRDVMLPTWSMSRIFQKLNTWTSMNTRIWRLTANGSATHYSMLSLLTIIQGAFDSDEHEHLPRTKYDIIVDETSNKPGEQAFEVSWWTFPSQIQPQ